jgi:hypothetical protein
MMKKEQPRTIRLHLDRALLHFGHNSVGGKRQKDLGPCAYGKLIQGLSAYAAADQGNSSVICCKTSLSRQSELFGFNSRLFISNKRLEEKYNTPWVALLHTLTEQWIIPASTLEACLAITKQLEPRLGAYNKLFFDGKQAIHELNFVNQTEINLSGEQRSNPFGIR